MDTPRDFEDGLGTGIAMMEVDQRESVFGWVRALAPARRPTRSHRVLLWVAVIAALSLIDLGLTMIYIMEIGLIEDNPIARMMIQMGGPWLLVAWKVATAGFACSVLIAAREHRVAEVGAVFGMIVMVWLTMHWIAYIEMSARLTCAASEMDRLGQGHWVSVSAGDANGT